MALKYEFDNWEEFSKARDNLQEYHDCSKCHGKIVSITLDKLGNTHCAYCGAVVQYPKMEKLAFEKFLKERLESEMKNKIF